MSRHANGRKGSTVIILGRNKQRSFPWIIVIREMAANFANGNIRQARSIANIASGLGAAQSGTGRHTRVFPVSRREFHLRPDAEQQAWKRKHEIHWIKAKKHNLLSLKLTWASDALFKLQAVSVPVSGCSGFAKRRSVLHRRLRHSDTSERISGRSWRTNRGARQR